MKNILKHLFLLFILISALSMKLFSQQDSLYNYLELAAKNNPSIRQRFTEYQAALQKIPQAGSLSDPQLDIGVFLSPMELVNGKQAADIKLMQMFPWFGVLRNAKDEMSQMANAKFDQFRNAKLQVFYNVQKTWYDLYKIRKDISISGKNIEILKVIQRLALVRYKSASSGGSSGSATPSGSMPSGGAPVTSGGSSGMQGMSGNPGNAGNLKQSPAQMQNGGMTGSSQGSGLSDLYRIEIETGDLRNNIELLKNEEQTTVALFNSFLNRKPSSPVFTADTVITDTLTLKPDAVMDSIRTNNPMLSMSRHEQKSYEARKKMVRGMGYPMLGLGIDYSVINSSDMASSPAMNGKDMVMPMVSVTIPIYRKKYKAMRKEAELLGEAASENYEATNNQLLTEYYQAMQLYKDAGRRVKLYNDQYQLASQTFDLVLKGFSAGSSTLTDVMRVRQQMLDYDQNRNDAAADLNTSVAWLKKLMASVTVNINVKE